MAKSAIEHVVDFLLEFLPDLIPSDLAKGVTKATIGTFKDQLKNLVKQPRLKHELQKAAQNAETHFRTEAIQQLGNDELVQAVASFPLWDSVLFQQTLRQLPEHWNEEYLASDLQFLIAKDWVGKFTDGELRQGAAIYLDCLREELLRVEVYGEIIHRLISFRNYQRTERIEGQLGELLEFIKQLIESSVAPQTVASPLFNILPPVTDFTGREKELDDLKNRFTRGALITGLSGGGGIGKTELARRLAQDLAGDFPEARLEIDLLGTLESPLSPEEAMRRLLEPFYSGQKLPDDLEQLKGLYQSTFASHKVLLLLDNAANAAQARELIPPSPSVAIVTSRQHFSLSEFGLDRPLRLDVLLPEEARQLLRQAARELLDVPDEALDELIRLCGGLPLALRVAVALLNDRDDWSLHTLIQRLTEERTRLKRLKRPDDLDVEATLSLSYKLLDDELKHRFRSLGVFPAPFWDISAAAVWQMEEGEEAGDTLGALLNRSLLKTSPSDFILGASETPLHFYSLHDLTRLYALERSREQSEYDQTVLMHARHYLELVGIADKQYLQGGQSIQTGLSLFREVWVHLSIAWERMRSDGDRQTQEKMQWLSDFPAKCPYILDLHLPPRQRIPLLEQALHSARILKDRMAEGIHLGNLGLAYADLGDARKAIEFYEQALEIDREIGDRRGEGNALGNLGLAYAALGDARKAIEFYEQQLVIVREIGDRRGEGNALGNLGNAYAALGDARKAIEFYEQRMIIAREIGDRRGEGNALANMGMIFKNLNQPDKAKELWKEALEIFKAIESPHVQTVQAWLAQLDGNLPEAQNQGLTAEQFIQVCVTTSREKKPEAAQLFEAAGKLAGDPNAPPEYRALGKVLQKVLMGDQHPDLSGLPEELARLVREALEG